MLILHCKTWKEEDIASEPYFCFVPWQSHASFPQTGLQAQSRPPRVEFWQLYYVYTFLWHMICHIIWMSPMLKFDLVRSSSVENFEDILTIFVIFTSSGELCETIMSFYIVLYHHIKYYVIWQDFMLKFDLLNIHSVLAFWRHFDQFCQSSKQETAILLGGKARLDTPSFTPLGSQTCILITYYIVTLLLNESQG